jgi:aminoglycoside phosphotransferase (APT) family kinase protein
MVSKQPHTTQRSSIPGIDLDDVARFLGERLAVAPDRQYLKAELLSGGRSNLTYTVTDGARTWVLRRPPLGHVLATAHDMHREARVMSALYASPVPVPKVIGLADAGAHGDAAPYYVMEKVDGVAFRGAEDFASLSVMDRGVLGRAFIDVLARLAAVDPNEVGLGDFGRPEGFAQRQVRRWGQQLAASTSREIKHVDRLGGLLATHVPTPQRASIVHGDFRLDNALVSRDTPGVVNAIIDWEMSTLGDPLMDLGMLHLFWEGWQGLPNPIAATPADFEGFPSWADLANNYAVQTGLDLGDFDWYSGFAFYKLAIICEGIHYRHSTGGTVGDGFDEIGDLVPALVERGLSTLADRRTPRS